MQLSEYCPCCKTKFDIKYYDDAVDEDPYFECEKECCLIKFSDFKSFSVKNGQMHSIAEPYKIEMKK